MVRVGASGRCRVLAGVLALLLAVGCIANPIGVSSADCEKKAVEEVYGRYMYDELKLRPTAPSKLSVKEVYGDYKHVEAPPSSWSGLSETEARSFTGLEVSIEPASFTRGDSVVANPHYETRCYPHVVEHFPFQTWSDDNVFGWEREVIHVLTVSRLESTGRELQVAEFEIVGDDLWIRDRAWLFVVRRQE